MTDKSIQLSNFGGRDEVKELAERIKSMLPGGTKYTNEEALTLAQISVAHDLDPFNGECWLIKSEKSGKVYGALIGIKGQRKHAKRQANYWGFGPDGGFTRILDPKKLEDYGATTEDIVYEYRIMDEVTSEGWTRAVRGYKEVGIPMEMAMEMAGNPPVTLGVGVFKQGEQTKMKPNQCAMFRAEKDALKRRFDVQFKIDNKTVPMALAGPDWEINGDEPEADEVIDAEYEEEPRSEEQIVAELGFS